MRCQEFDWNGFALDEITAPERRRMEEHLLTCAACGEELEAIRLTVTAMKRLPVMAPPRRISFVSDPVFEPTWWQRFLSSGPRLAFASAGMLSMAIVAHGFVMRPQAVTVQAPAPVQQAAVQQTAPQVSAEEIRVLVMKEVSAKLSEQEKRAEQQRRADMTDVKNAFDLVQKRINTNMLSAARYGGD